MVAKSIPQLIAAAAAKPTPHLDSALHSNHMKHNKNDDDAAAVVVGTGIAGLTCASELAKASCRVLVYEASAQIGGRLRQTTSSPSTPSGIELGAQFVHGTSGDMSARLLDEVGREHVRSLPWPDATYSKERGWCRADDDAVLKAAEEAMEGLESTSAPATESVAEALADSDTAVLETARAVYSNDYGTDLHGLGAAAVAEELAAWESGEDYGVLVGRQSSDNNWSVLVKSLAKNLDITTNARLVRVVHWQEGDRKPLELHFSDGRVANAAVAILALPLTVLREGDVIFDPPLPAWKLRAWCIMQMDNCLKVSHHPRIILFLFVFCLFFSLASGGGYILHPYLSVPSDPSGFGLAMATLMFIGISLD